MGVAAEKIICGTGDSDKRGRPAAAAPFLFPFNLCDHLHVI